MICRNCGKGIIAESNFCPECGFPIDHNETSAYSNEIRREDNLFQETNVQRESANAKKRVSIFGLLAVAIVALVVLIIILAPSKHGYDSPEEAAITYLEGLLFDDPDKCLSAMHPSLIDDTSELEVLVSCATSHEIDVRHYSSGKVEVFDNDDEDSILFKEAINHVFDENIEIIALADVECCITYIEDGEQEESEISIAVIKIDERWYSVMDSRVQRYYFDKMW